MKDISHQAVLILGFGAPAQIEEVRPFVREVLRGRPLPDEAMEEMIKRYEAIGGGSPFSRVAARHAQELQAELARRGLRLPVYTGMCHWHPFVRDTLDEMASRKIRRAVCVILAPFGGAASLGRYLGALAAARSQLGGIAPVIDIVPAWNSHPLFIDALAGCVREAVHALPEGMRSSATWVFTAHSLPASAPGVARYVRDFRTTAGLLAGRFGNRSWHAAYQSPGMLPREPWLGPDVEETIRRQAERGAKAVMAVPLGFACENAEVLYDLDRRGADLAASLGMAFARSLTAGQHPSFIRMLADAVLSRVRETKEMSLARRRQGELTERLAEKGALNAWQQEALQRVPRHLFIDRYVSSARDKRILVEVKKSRLTEEKLRRIYSDEAIVTTLDGEHSSSSSQPSLMMQMLEFLELEKRSKVLEIGTGTGWNAGLIAIRTGEPNSVYSLDIDPELIVSAREHLAVAGLGGVNLKAGDGGAGWPENAPYQRIIVTAGCREIPAAWREQLSEGGIMVVPFGIGGGHPILKLQKLAGTPKGKFMTWAGFMPLRGEFMRSDDEYVYSADGGPILKRLLAEEEGGQLPLADSGEGFNWHFFLHIGGWGFRPVRGFPRGAMWDPKAETLLGPFNEEGSQEVRGSAGVVAAIKRAYSQWKGLGKPKFDDYTVEIIDPKDALSMENVWILERRSTVIRFSLPERVGG